MSVKRKYVPVNARTARRLNKIVREAIESSLADYKRIYPGALPEDYKLNYERRRANSEVDHVFGYGNDLVDHLVSIYRVGESEILLSLPNDYKGWVSASVKQRLQITIYDRINEGMRKYRAHGKTSVHS